MEFVDEYRDAKAAERYAQAIARLTTQRWAIMEVCGGQTHAIVKYGVDKLLPKDVTLVHGPGCPVCVTPADVIDKAIKIASCSDVILCSFGDMLRVPGNIGDLLLARASGGDVRIVYSPLDALKIAQDTPQKQVVFFAVGFETTAPHTALAAHFAQEQQLKNISFLVAHFLIPPAMEMILSSPNNRVNGFLAAGHVCTVTGYVGYESLSQRYRVPIVVTGFEPLDILQAIHMCIRQLEEGAAYVENQYSRSVKPEGNQSAQRMIHKVFKVVPRKWRGIGEISQSGLCLREDYREYDAEKRFGVTGHQTEESSECISGLILQGLKKPHECPAFGKRCSPENPLGATMVSSEGICAAYYCYRRRNGVSPFTEVG